MWFVFVTFWKFKVVSVQFLLHSNMTKLNATNGYIMILENFRKKHQIWSMYVGVILVTIFCQRSKKEMSFAQWRPKYHEGPTCHRNFAPLAGATCVYQGILSILAKTQMCWGRPHLATCSSPTTPTCSIAGDPYPTCSLPATPYPTCSSLGLDERTLGGDRVKLLLLSGPSALTSTAPSPRCLLLLLGPSVSPVGCSSTVCLLQPSRPEQLLQPRRPEELLKPRRPPQLVHLRLARGAAEAS